MTLIEAMTLLNHPQNNTHVYHSLDTGRYHRVNALRALAASIHNTLLLRAEDPMVGHVSGYASRAVCLAEALLVELELAEMGKELTEEMNMTQGTLFQAFRTEQAVKR